MPFRETWNPDKTRSRIRQQGVWLNQGTVCWASLVSAARVALVKCRDLHWAMMAHREQKDTNLSSIRMLIVADGANPCESLAPSACTHAHALTHTHTRSHTHTHTHSHTHMLHTLEMCGVIGPRHPTKRIAFSLNKKSLFSYKVDI